MRAYQRFLRKWITTNLHLVTKDNFTDIAELAVHDHQQDHAADTMYAIAQASFHPNYHCRAIVDKDGVVGFLMYAAPGEGDDPGDYAIYHLMVDRRYQGRGHGRRAVALALAEICKHGDVQRIWTSYLPGNAVAKELYAACGFAEARVEDDGEMYAVWTPDPY
jgi:diamine N-acetyltransferase